MNKHFMDLRKKYPHFYYHSYDVDIKKDSVDITWYFEIEDLMTFNPTTKIFIKDLDISNKDKNFINYLVFHLGLVELISYWKATCSPNVIVNCGKLNEEQINWFKKLYYNGLGEFFYVNDLKTDIDTFMDLSSDGEDILFDNSNYQGLGNLIPIGGGKDSTVSLEILKDYFKDNTPFMINPKDPMLECVYVAGYDDDKVIKVTRKIDSNLLELNKQGYLNGHTPFSSMVAFLTYLVAYLSDKKYIVLSNEASANEATVLGESINHQYSKTYEFENDFNNYTKKYFQIDIKYFSLLRGLSEFQIGYLFSHYEQYHQVFKSCNVGSKSIPWKWCGECPKCLFVYTILSPFLYKDKLVNIFNKDLFEDEQLLTTYLELLGLRETKPFECVGTVEEVKYATIMLIKKLLDKNEELPYLLKYYYEHYSLDEIDDGMLSRYNNENNIPEEFNNKVLEALKQCQNK